jgi:hypothetical protein
MLSAAMPASADVNLLQNPGFETGEMDPWTTGVSGGYRPFDLTPPGVWAHSGAYSVGVGVDIGEGGAWVRQDILPGCADYLEFWYSGGFGSGGGDMEFRIYYSDGTVNSKDFPESPSNVWISVHENLDTTKLVEAVEVRIEGFVELNVDDFDLEACPAAVGGVVMPLNNLVMLSPWLAVIGVVGCIGTVVVVAKKRGS